MPAGPSANRAASRAIASAVTHSAAGASAVTVACGGNLLAGNDAERIVAAARTMLARDPRSFARPEGWDGRAAERIVARVERFFAEGAGL